VLTGINEEPVAAPRNLLWVLAEEEERRIVEAATNKASVADSEDEDGGAQVGRPALPPFSISLKRSWEEIF
jgi:hypothetical protein